MNVKKLIRDGEVAVLISPGRGPHWGRGALRKWLMFDHHLVKMVLRGQGREAASVASAKTGLWFDGSDVTVAWVPVGSRFAVMNDNGAEYIVMKDEIEWEVA